MVCRLALTPGEPAGIGPDVVIQLAQQGAPDEWVVYADPGLMQRRARVLGLPLRLREPGPQPQPLAPAELAIRPVPLVHAEHIGQPSPDNAPYVLATLTQALQDCVHDAADALVTGPVHKGVINEAGIPFSGHTEFLAEHTNTPRVVMMLATGDLRVALATTHLPLAQVPAAITQDLLSEVLGVLHRDLQRHFGIDQPRILVCGLNPHAGEGGHLGREEIDVIAPVLERLRQDGIALTGPLPADTLFTPAVLQKGDAVLAMYHDQGLPVLKYQGFGEAVNITLGLPIIRTSVDHGTAFDLAGSGRADSGSLATAIAYAANMVRRRHGHSP